MIDLFQTGAYVRCPGGNVERPDLQRPVIRWAALNIGTDPCVNRDPGVWDRQREVYRQAGIPHFAWLHCRSIGDVEELIDVGETWLREGAAKVIGLNIEDVVGDGLDLREVAGTVLDFWVNPHEAQMHMATLAWIQNGQRWEALDFVVSALEIFPDEQKTIFPDGYDPKVVQDCIDHAFAEGLSKVTLMFKTKAPNTRGQYGAEFEICHSLYTADDISPTPEDWAAWDFDGSCRKLTKEEPMPSPTKPPLTATQVPYTGPYSLATGPHRSRGPTCKALKIGAKRMGHPNFAGKDNSQFDDHYSEKLEQAMDALTDPSWSGYGEKRWTAVRGLVVPSGRPATGEYALNKEARDLILKDAAQMKQPELPDLGPLVQGGPSMLDQSPTHPTTGIDFFIAYDTAFKAGTIIIAPEDIIVDTKTSTSNPGKAFYATGVSKIRHWFGHLVSAPVLGTEFTKGAKIGVVLDHEVGGGPHCHHGVNIEALWGKGKQLEWGADGDGPAYTYGSPTIREQLERALI